MSKHVSEYLTSTRQFFGDGEYWLTLSLASTSDLEKRFGWTLPDGRRQPKGIITIYGALLGCLYEDEGKLKLIDGGDVFPHEINEIVRQALICGNSGPDFGEGTDVGPQRAGQLVALYGYPERPIEEIASVAFRVLHALVVGDPAQREALPELAAASDAASERLSKQAGEALGPTMRAQAEQAAGAE